MTVRPAALPMTNDLPPTPPARLPFHNRHDAGQQLGAHLRLRHAWPDTVVLGLPRGGVPVAAEVARALTAPLDVFMVRKLGLPFQPEVAMGAVASGGVEWLNRDLLARLPLPPGAVEEVRRHELRELARREALYRAGRPPLDLTGRTALLVDDGLATGATMHAALRAVRALGAARVAVAVPVAPPDTCGALRPLADEVICLHTPPGFRAVGQYYLAFAQTTDAEVLAALPGHQD